MILFFGSAAFIHQFYKQKTATKDVNRGAHTIHIHYDLSECTERVPGMCQVQMQFITSFVSVWPQKCPCCCRCSIYSIIISLLLASHCGHPVVSLTTWSRSNSTEPARAILSSHLVKYAGPRLCIFTFHAPHI